MKPTENLESLGPFVAGETINAEENLYVEFKSIKGNKPVESIKNQSDEYAVAFLNGEGGRIIWGIDDSERKIIGVTLSTKQKDEIRRVVSDKLQVIIPHLDPTHYSLSFFSIVNDLRNKDLYLVELLIPDTESNTVYFTSSRKAFVRLNGSNKKLDGPALTEFIKRRTQSNLITSNDDVDESLRSLATRVRRIFTEHGLLPAHLPRFLETRKAPFSIKLTDLQSDSNLCRWLDEIKIEWIAQTFLIRREWIDGEDESIHQQFYFDRDPGHFFSTVSKHADQLVFEDTRDSPYAYFVRRGIGKDWEKKGDGRVFVIIAIPIASLSNERTIFKYISDFEPYSWTNHARGHIQLRAWARLLDLTKNIHCYGREVSLEIADEIWNNSIFLRGVIKNQLRHPEDDWHPEDYARSTKESMVAKATDTLPHVIEFLKQHNLPVA